MTSRSSRGNWNLKVDTLLDYSSSLTSGTFSSLSKNIPHSITILTINLSLSVHARTNLHHLDSGALAFAIRTLRNIRTSFAITNIAESGSLVKKRHVSSSVQFIESNLKLFSHGLHLRLLFRTFLLLTSHHSEYFWIIASLLFWSARLLS